MTTDTLAEASAGAIADAPPASSDFVYEIDKALVGRDLARTVRTLADDENTIAFVARQLARRHWAARWTARAVLRAFMSDFAVNGMLGTYRLQLLSTAQWMQLCAGQPASELGRPLGRLLDVGAGIGDVTGQLAPLADEVVAIETAAPLVRRLRAAGFEAHDLDITTASIPGAPYDTIALLNVLDRCASPVTLLGRLRDALSDGGRLLISMPLPYQPMHYRGARSAAPREPLPIGRGPWERQARDLVERVLEPAGLHVEVLSRAPYLSEGDRRVPYYELDAAIVVCRVGVNADTRRRARSRR